MNIKLIVITIVVFAHFVSQTESLCDISQSELITSPYYYLLGEISIDSNEKNILLTINMFSYFYLNNLFIEMNYPLNSSNNDFRYNLTFNNLSRYIYLGIPIPEDLDVSNPDMFIYFEYLISTNISDSAYGYDYTPSLYRQVVTHTYFFDTIKYNCSEFNPMNETIYSSFNLNNINIKIYNSSDRLSSFSSLQNINLDSLQSIHIYFGPNNSSNISNCHYFYGLNNFSSLENLVCPYMGDSHVMVESVFNYNIRYIFDNRSETIYYQNIFGRNNNSGLMDNLSTTVDLINLLDSIGSIDSVENSGFVFFFYFLTILL